MNSVGLVINVYERTYRRVLAPGFFTKLIESLNYNFAEVSVLVSNVDNRNEVNLRAKRLLEDGEITSYYFVEDLVPQALLSLNVSPRMRKKRPFLLDFGLVMPLATETKWLLGWDAEAQMSKKSDWIDRGIEFLQSDKRIFHVSLNWPPLSPGDPGLEGEVIEWKEGFGLSWGFSDHVFLLERNKLLQPIYRTFAPRALVRHAPHPYTFEYRMESYQRCSNLLKATFKDLFYEMHSETNAGVIQRTGEGFFDKLTLHTLRKLELSLLNRLPESYGPRVAKKAPYPKATGILSEN